MIAGLMAIKGLNGLRGVDNATDADIDAFLAGGGNRMVEITGLTFCGPCRKMKSTVEGLASSNPGQVMVVNVETYNGKYGGTVPHYIFNNGSGEHYGIIDSSTLSGFLGGGASAPASSPVSSGSGGGDNWVQAYLDGVLKERNTATGQWRDIGSAAATSTGDGMPAPISSIARANPPVTSYDTPIPSPFSSAASVVAPAEVQNVTVNVSASPTDWSYVLKNRNAKWEAVILDGAQMFRNKRTGQFVSSIVGMSGMRGLALASVTGMLGTATLPVKVYTSEGGGISVKTAGMIIGGIAATGVIGYLIYKALK